MELFHPAGHLGSEISTQVAGSRIDAVPQSGLQVTCLDHLQECPGEDEGEAMESP